MQFKISIGKAGHFLPCLSSLFPEPLFYQFNPPFGLIAGLSRTFDNWFAGRYLLGRHFTFCTFKFSSPINNF